MTSAPMSDSIAPAVGTKAHIATSTTLIPSSGLPIALPSFPAHARPNSAAFASVTDYA